jgi:hypothetical protein
MEKNEYIYNLVNKKFITSISKRSHKGFLFIFSNVFKIVLLLIPLSTAIAQSYESKTIYTADHTLTIYVIHSVKPLNWESPASLFKSYMDGFRSTILRKEKTMLGHLFVRLSSPLLAEPLYAGITNSSRKEQRDYVLKEKIGLGVLGAGMKARLQYIEELLFKIEFYANKNELAFITYTINEDGARRIINFYQKFIQRFNENQAGSDFYGGAYWPLYYSEGSGCSAFGLALLELANIKGDEIKLWKKEVNIPMNLIGGRFNHKLKIGIKKLKSADSWHSGNGIEEIDYTHFEIYDPTLIYNWILAQVNQVPEARCPGYYPADDPQIPGLLSDRCSVAVDRFAPIFQIRPDTNLFIKYHYLKMDSLRKDSIR